MCVRMRLGCGPASPGIDAAHGTRHQRVSAGAPASSRHLPLPAYLFGPPCVPRARPPASAAALLAFSLPKAYEAKKEEVDKVIKAVKAKVDELMAKFNEAVLSKIPKAKKVQ